MVNGARFESAGGMGGSGFGFGDGFGGGGILSGILLASLLGRRGFGGDDNCKDNDNLAGNVASKVVDLQNSANLRQEVAGVATSVAALGNDLKGALAQQTLGQANEFRNLDNQICAAEKAAITASFEARIAALQSTNEIKSDINMLSVKTDAQTCEILRAINADGDATRALINVNTVNDLRDELLRERRRSDSREIEINVTQTNQQLQNQMQAQFQAQRDDADRRFSALFSQVAKSGQDIIAVGSLLNGTTQTASPVNVKS